jgi:predicted nucleic acid-binding protein
VSPVVIDASVGAEIVAETRRGRALARLVPEDAEGWVSEHFYAEVLAVVRRWMLINDDFSEAQATASVGRLRSWRLRRVAVAPLIEAAWSYRHNMTAADALYVALADGLGADFLTDDHRLADSPTFPRNVKVLRLPVQRPQA